MTLNDLKTRRNELQNLIARVETMQFAPGTSPAMQRTIRESASARHRVALKRVNRDIARILVRTTAPVQLQPNPVLPADFQLSR